MNASRASPVPTRSASGRPSPASPIPQILVPAIGGAFAQARSAAHDRQSGDVRGGDRRHAHHHPVPARPVHRRRASLVFAFQINLWLWFTVLFANFAEAVAEGRGKAQAATLRRTRSRNQRQAAGKSAATWREVPATTLKPGDIVLVEAGDLIPSDGEVIEGVASVNEAAITGESAPVIRETGGDRSAVTGGTHRDLRLDQGAASPRRRARPFSTA